MNRLPPWIRSRPVKVLLGGAILAVLAASVLGLTSPSQIVKRVVVRPIASAAQAVVPTPYSCSWQGIGGGGSDVIMATGLNDAGKKAAQNGYDAHCSGVGGSADFDDQGNRVKPVKPDPEPYWNCTSTKAMPVTVTARTEAEAVTAAQPNYGTPVPHIDFRCIRATS